MRSLQRIALAMLLLALLLPMEVTAQPATPPASPAASPIAGTRAATSFPLTIENCGTTLTFTKPPERVVPLALNTTEILLALGLKDRIAGVVGVGNAILPQYQDEFTGVNVIAEKAFPYPSREVLLSAAPDLLLSGYGGDFSEGAYGSRESYHAQGISTLLMTDACDTAPAVTLEDTYADILLIGRIFSVPEQASALVTQMQSEAVVTTSGAPPLRAFVFAGDTPDATTTVGGRSLITDLVARAGGENIFADLPQQFIPEVSTEQIIARDPQVIVIIEYAAVPAQDIIATLSSDPNYANVSAIENQRFVVIGATYTAPSVRNGMAVSILADEFSE